MSKKLTQDEYIDKVSFIHNNKYEYSKTTYTGNKNKLIITCKELVILNKMLDLIINVVVLNVL